MTQYTTFFNSPVQIGSGVDNINSRDIGEVVLVQEQVIGSPGNGTAYFQLPLTAGVFQVTLDTTDATPTAGTYTVFTNATATAVGQNVVSAGTTLLNARTQAVFTPAGQGQLSSLNAARQVIGVTIAGLTPISNVRVRVLYYFNI